jgi:hypothetical protein
MHNASMIKKTNNISFTGERTYRAFLGQGGAGLLQCEDCCLVSAP